MNDEGRTWAEWFVDRPTQAEIEKQKIIDEWYAPSKEEEKASNTTYYENVFILWLVFGDHPFVRSIQEPERWTDGLTDKMYTLEDMHYEYLAATRLTFRYI